MLLEKFCNCLLTRQSLAPVSGGAVELIPQQLAILSRLLVEISRIRLFHGEDCLETEPEFAARQINGFENEQFDSALLANVTLTPIAALLSVWTGAKIGGEVMLISIELDSNVVLGKEEIQLHPKQPARPVVFQKRCISKTHDVFPAKLLAV